jgi:PAS domain S-box-containing protein
METYSDISEFEALLYSKETAATLRVILGSIPIGIIILRAPDGKILHINEFLAALVGRPRQEIEGLLISDIGHIPMFDESGRPAPAHERPLARALRGETVTGFEAVLEADHGERIPVIIKAAPIHNAAADLIGAIATVRDVRRAKALERSLRDSEQLFRALADSVPNLVWIADRKGSVYWYNQNWYRYTGMSMEESAGLGWLKPIHPDHAEHVFKSVQHALDTGEPFEDTFLMRSAKGHYRWFISRALPSKDAEGQVTRWFGANTDVTEQVEAQELLRTLLKEVTHRVKNSLALVSSLLKLQARTLESDARHALQEASRRVIAVASVHDQLWRSAEVRDIDLQPFLSDLCSKIAEAAPGHKTVWRIEPAVVSTELAVPIGLFINELLTNAYKYAYPEGEEGEVRILGTCEPEGRYRLEVSDSGRGLPAGFGPAKTENRGKCLGMQVITSLAQQLGAN